MKAMVLAAGRGKRMRHLTENTPKPLLRLWGSSLIEWPLQCLSAAGFHNIVINTAYHGSQIINQIGDGSRYGVSVAYSEEGSTAEEALGTLGAIVKALPLLTETADPEEPFVVVSGDVVSAFDYRSLYAVAEKIRQGHTVAHLVLVPNPDFKEVGDMALDNGKITRSRRDYTYGNIGVFSPKIFRALPVETKDLFPWLYQYTEQGLVSGELFEGQWANVGTPEQLDWYNKQTKFSFITTDKH